MRNFEITKREVLASISIIAVMILVGILISAKITERQMDRNENKCRERIRLWDT